jgi:hypothetical protein
MFIVDFLRTSGGELGVVLLHHTQQRRKEKKEQKKSSHELYWNSKSKIFSVFFTILEKRNGGFGLHMLFVRGRILVDSAYYCIYCYAKMGLKASQL